LLFVESGTAGEQTTGSTGSESSGVLSTNASGQSGSAAANASVTPARSASSGKLPFTGSEDWLIVAAGALMLLSGLALRRRVGSYR
jgi:LPXTG-motif cell wall-anchored protein